MGIRYLRSTWPLTQPLPHISRTGRISSIPSTGAPHGSSVMPNVLLPQGLCTCQMKVPQIPPRLLCYFIIVSVHKVTISETPSWSSFISTPWSPFPPLSQLSSTPATLCTVFLAHILSLCLPSHNSCPVRVLILPTVFSPGLLPPRTEEYTGGIDVTYWQSKAISEDAFHLIHIPVLRAVSTWSPRSIIK